MYNQFQLPGQVRRGPNSAIPAAFLTLLLFGSSLYALRNWSAVSLWLSRSSTPTQTAMASEDFAVHHDNVRAQLVKAASDIKRSQELLLRVGPYLRGRAYMDLQARWVEGAHSFADAALQSVEKALQENEMAERLIKER